MKQSIRIAINAATSWTATAVSAAISFLLIPVLITDLGREGYGLISVVGSIIATTGIVDLALRTSLSRHLAEQVAHHDVRRFNEIASSAFAVYIVVGVFFASLLVAFAPFVADVFRVSGRLREQAIFLIRWYGGLAVLLSVVGPVYSATLVGANRFDLLNLMGTTVGILRGLAILILLSIFDAGLYGWAAVMLIANILHIGWLRRTARRHWPQLHVAAKYVRRDAMTQLFALGGYMFVIQLTNLISVQSDPIVITVFLGPASLALYSPALSVVSMVRPLILTLVDQLQPVATGFYVKKQWEELRAVLFRGSRYTALLGVLPFTLLAGFAEPLMRVWLQRSLGEDYRIAAQVLAIWAAAELMAYASGTQWPVLLAMQRIKFLSMVQIPQAALNIAISIFLVTYAGMGVVGVVIPTVFLRAIVLLIVAKYTANLCGISARTYFRVSYMRPLLTLLLVTAAAVGMQRAVPPESVVTLGLEVFATCLLWLSLSWSLGLTREDRSTFIAILVRAKTRLLG